MRKSDKKKYSNLIYTFEIAIYEFLIDYTLFHDFLHFFPKNKANLPKFTISSFYLEN